MAAAMVAMMMMVMMMLHFVPLAFLRHHITFLLDMIGVIVSVAWCIGAGRGGLRLDEVCLFGFILRRRRPLPDQILLRVVLVSL